MKDIDLAGIYIGLNVWGGARQSCIEMSPGLSISSATKPAYRTPSLLVSLPSGTSDSRTGETASSHTACWTSPSHRKAHQRCCRRR